MTLDALALQGKGQVCQPMAAALRQRLSDLRNPLVREILSDFVNTGHRLELVSTIHHVDYINDSKASNINATWFALESMNRPVVWIAGGQEGSGNYTLLTELVKSKVKVLICLGEQTEALFSTYLGVVPNIYRAKNMEEAVQIAFQVSKEGDTVLLSPACPSFDRYENYEERGNHFRDIVLSL